MPISGYDNHQGWYAYTQGCDHWVCPYRQSWSCTLWLWQPICHAYTRGWPYCTLVWVTYIIIRLKLSISRYLAMEATISTDWVHDYNSGSAFSVDWFSYRSPIPFRKKQYNNIVTVNQCPCTLEQANTGPPLVHFDTPAVLINKSIK